MKIYDMNSSYKIVSAGLACQQDYDLASKSASVSQVASSPYSDTQKKPGMQERIKAIAIDLLIRRGYRGTNFGDIAEALSTTRANIHYHFGNKNALVEEIITDYVNFALEQFHAIWTSNTSSLTEKIDATVSFNFARYERFNSPTNNDCPWSLISRMRGDNDSLSPKSIATLRRFAFELNTAVRIGVAGAISRGELASVTPIDDVVVQIFAIINGAGSITQNGQGFQRLDELYRAFLNTTLAAYGAVAKPSAASIAR